MMLKLRNYLVFVLMLTISFGCSTTRQNTGDARSNVRKQRAIKQQLVRLNRQNVNLQQSLRESSAINLQTGGTIDNNLENSNSAANERRLQQFKNINLETQAALESLEEAVRFDTEKNQTISQMLDELIIETQAQRDQVNRIRGVLNQQQENSWSHDMFHVGIAPLALYGTSSEEDSSGDTVEFVYTGTGATAYFTYVGEYDNLISLKYSKYLGQLSIKDDKSGAYQQIDSNLFTLSAGVRITSVETFNILPELFIGTGNSIVHDCKENKCETENETRTKLTTYGLNVPFFHNLTSVFSWGFKLFFQKMDIHDMESYQNGKKVGEFSDTSTIFIGGAGLMLGAAW